MAGHLGGKNVLCMQGRFHYYEGHEMQAIALPVRVFKALGCRALILTNAAGGVNWDFNVGDFMLITDHINFMGANPLRGANDDSIGPRFCDMTHVYAPDLQELALKVAAAQNLVLQKGVYLGYMGPSFETPGRNPRLPHAGCRRRGHEHRSRGHRRQSLRAARAGAKPHHQHGRRHGGQAAVRRRGH